MREPDTLYLDMWANFERSLYSFVKRLRSKTTWTEIVICAYIIACLCMIMWVCMIMWATTRPPKPPSYPTITAEVEAATLEVEAALIVAEEE